MADKKSLLFQVPGTITSIKTMSQFLRIQIDTQETLSASAYEKLFQLHNKLGWLSFNIHKIEAEDVVNLPEIKVAQKKSLSLRLKNVLYRRWEQDKMNFSEFEDYYEWYMESLIDRVKEQLV